MPSKKAPFQLKPKHLIRAVLAVSLAAIIVLAVGVLNTFKPRNEERVKEEKVQKQEKAVNRVEVLKPDGSDEQGSIVINPDAVNMTPQARQNTPEDAGAAQGAAILPQRAARAETEQRNYSEEERAEQQRRARWRREREMEQRRRAEAQNNTVKAERVTPATPAPNSQAAVPATERLRPAAEPRRIENAESKPAPRREVRQEAEQSKPAPRREIRQETAEQPKPAPKPQQKEVIDNLF